MILKTAANYNDEGGYIEAGKEGGYYEVGGQRTEIGGGGGSSDFSTAEVTVNVEGFSSGMAEYYIANAVHDFNDELRSTISLPFPSIGYTNPVSAVLCKGKTEWQINAGSDNIPITGVNGTGSVEVREISGDYVISITGECSITITYA